MGTESGGAKKDSVMHLIKILAPLNYVSNNIDNRKKSHKVYQRRNDGSEEKGPKTTCTRG